MLRALRQDAWRGSAHLARANLKPVEKWRADPGFVTPSVMDEIRRLFSLLGLVLQHYDGVAKVFVSKVLVEFYEEELLENRIVFRDRSCNRVAAGKLVIVFR